LHPNFRRNCWCYFDVFLHNFWKDSDFEQPVIEGGDVEMPDVTEDESDRALLALTLGLSDHDVRAIVQYADRRAS
jgi:hypothetical protein